ncbi:MAG: DUF922 domain-containing protein [Chloroflexota bacterium]
MNDGSLARTSLSQNDARHRAAMKSAGVPMKTHRATARHRKRRAADEAAAPVAAYDEAAASPAQSLETLRQPRASRSAHGAAVIALQRVVGNAAVERMLAGQVAQRYPVDVPEDASCDQVREWMETSNPYAREGNAAATTVTFSWSATWRITGRAPNFKLRLSNPQVTMDGPHVDMPQRKPHNPKLRAAWQRMYRTLRDHERRHEAIAHRWRRILLGRLRKLSIPVTAASREEVAAQARELVGQRWDEWIEQHQAQQSEIDPFQALLDCP